VTCVVAIEDKHGAVIGCDSMISEDNFASETDTAKWAEIDGIYFGVAGDCSALPAIKYGLRSGARRKRESIGAHVYRLTQTVKGLTTGADFSYLLVANGFVYFVDCNGCALRDPCGYAAVGTGAPVAIATIDAYRTIGHHVDAEELALSALVASARRCPSVRGPFKVVRCE
jgi:20S proteasome alpha/beta subunit